MARHASPDLPAKFLAAIKRGQITSGSQAAAKFGVSPTTIFKWLRDAKDNGYAFATSGGEAWSIIRSPR